MSRSQREEEEMSNEVLNHNPNQSSVDWVIGEIMKHQITFYGTSSMPLYIIEKGRAMHKKEIIDAINIVGKKNVIKVNKIIEMISETKGDIFKNNENDAINYYNETFQK